MEEIIKIIYRDQFKEIERLRYIGLYSTAQYKLELEELGHTMSQACIEFDVDLENIAEINITGEWLKPKQINKRIDVTLFREHYQTKFAEVEWFIHNFKLELYKRQKEREDARYVGDTFLILDEVKK